MGCRNYGGKHVLYFGLGKILRKVCSQSLVVQDWEKVI